MLHEFKQVGKLLQLINESIIIRPKIARWYAARAQIYRGLGRNQFAFYDLNAAIRIEPRTWQYYTSRALCLRKLKRYQDALSDISTALDNADPPFLPLYRFYRGTILMHMEDYTGAIQEFTTSIQPGEKHSAKARLLRAVCYEKLGRTLEAMNDLKKLATADNASANAMNSYGISLCELGRYSEAIEIFTAAAERSFANPLFAAKCLDNRSWAEFHTGKFRNAMETVTLAINQGGEERATDPSPLFHRGAIALGQNQPIKALPDLLRAAELNEALIRKELRRATKDTDDLLFSMGGDNSSEVAGSAGGGRSLSRGKSVGGGMSSTSGTGRRNNTGGGNTIFDQLPPEAAAALGEATSSAFLGSSSVSVNGATTASSVVLGGDDDITDSDTYTDAIREQDMTMVEIDRKKFGASSPNKGKQGNTGNTSRPTTREGKPSSGLGDTGGGDGNKTGDDKSDTESVRSGSTNAGARSMRKIPAARNLGRAAPRSKILSNTNQPKPWTVVPSSIKDKPWPEQPLTFTIPQNRVLCMITARIQAYLGLCYELLNHYERALHHYQNALLVWPSYVPAQYHAGCMLHKLRRFTEADALLSILINSTAHIQEEVEVIPPAYHTNRSSNILDGEDGIPITTTKPNPENSNTIEAIWTPTESRTAIYQLGISTLELIPPLHPDEAKHLGIKETPAATEVTDEAAPAPTEETAAPTTTTENTPSSSSENDPPISHRHSVDYGSNTPLQIANRRCRAKALLIRGITRQEQGLHVEAAEDLSDSITNNGKVGEAYYKRAISYLAIGKARAAINDCKTALSRGYNTPDVRDIFGQAYSYIGDYTEAVTQYTIALRLSPDTPIYLTRRAEAQRLLGDIASAIKDSTNALLITPNAPDILAQRADSHYQGNDWDAAVTDYRTALTVLATTNARNKEAFQARLYFSVGLSLANSDKYNDAINAFTSAIQTLEPLCSVHGRRHQNSNGSDADDESTIFGSERMSRQLAAALATAALRMDSPKLRLPNESKTENIDDATRRARSRAAADAAIANAHSSHNSVPLSTGVGQALRGLAKTSSSGGRVKGAMGKWAHKAKTNVTPGISLNALKQAEQATIDAGLTVTSPLRNLGARERYLAELAHVNATSSPALVRLRIASIHERAKARQMLLQHREAISDFTEVLSSCPTSAHALLRRGLSYKALNEYVAAAEDIETARTLVAPELQATFQLNYAGIGDVNTVVLCAAGEEIDYPILGIDNIE